MCNHTQDNRLPYEFSGEASGHAGHAEDDQKYSRVKNFFTCLKMEVCFEIFLKIECGVSELCGELRAWVTVASHAHLR